MSRLRYAVARGLLAPSLGLWGATCLGGAIVLGGGLVGCSGQVGSDPQHDAPTDDSADRTDQGDGNGPNSSVSRDRTDDSNADVAPGPDVTDGDLNGTSPSPSTSRGNDASTSEPSPLSNSEGAVVPARIRRLSNLEYGNSVRALLGTTEPYEQRLPADVRQHNFTVNQAQTVSSDWNAEVERLAKAAAKAVIEGGGLDGLSPCPGQTTDACAEDFIDVLATKAFRRPVTADEHTDLAAIYRQVADEAGFSRGLELVIAATLQAPSFIYVTELGAPGEMTTTLTGEEIATAIAFVTTQAPPDDALLQAGRQGELSDATTRAQHATRLLSTESGKRTLATMVVEWFTADWVLNAAKDNIPEFNDRRSQLLDESRNFIRTVIDSHAGDVRTLLTGDFTVVSPDVAGYYGLSGSGQVSLVGTPRVGIITQAAFLGGHSSPTQSSPVKRGAAFLRQVLCTDPPDPSTINLVVAAPQPDPSKSTRQLFAAHSADVTCQACHAVIDPIGFAFEGFDEGGRVRSGPEDNNGHPVETAGSVKVGGTEFVFEDAADLIRQVADSELGQACVARTATRFALAFGNTATELAFVQQWKQLDPPSRTQLGVVLTALISSDLFVQRKAM